MSEHKKSKPPVLVVETPTRSTRLRAWLRSRRTRRTAIITVLVLLAGAGALYGLSQRAEQQQARQEAAARAPRKLSSAEYERRMNDVAATRDVKAALSLAQEQADNSVERQMVLASAYANDNQLDKALAIYDEQQKKNALSAGYLSGAAEIAEQAGQKQRAIAYYEALIAKAKAEASQDPTWQTNVKRAEARIAELRKQ